MYVVFYLLMAEFADAVFCVDSPPPGVRRGTRHRYKPLEHWRLEKVVYGKRENGISYVPQIKEIIRVSTALPSLPLFSIVYIVNRSPKIMSNPSANTETNANAAIRSKGTNQKAKPWRRLLAWSTPKKGGTTILSQVGSLLIIYPRKKFLDVRCLSFKFVVEIVIDWISCRHRVYCKDGQT